MNFDGLKYTRKKLIQQLILVQEHSSDGSALDMGCSCIQEKHLEEISGLSAEGVTLAVDEKEKVFYQWLGTWADVTLRDIIKTLQENNRVKEEAMYRALADLTRELRLQVSDESFIVPEVVNLFAKPCGCKGCVPCGKTK